MGYAASPRGSPITAQAFPRNDRYGIAHISYGNGSFSPERYEFARSAGVGWNRWAFYWNEIERAPEAFDYSTQDATVAADRAQGLRILGVILGTPAWAAEGARVTGLPQPQVGQRGYSEVGRIQAHGATGPNTTTMPPRGLERAVFSDGTDTPGPGKTINADNPWARFVYQTAKRYRGKVHAWEIWNEPDFTPNASTDWFGFWDGTIEDYARLLKVGYLAVKAADPDAIVVMAGLAYWFQPDFFPRLLAALKKDPTGAAHGYYFDVTAWHLYSRASQLLHRTQWVEDQLVRVGIGRKPLWVTETTLPVCGDPALQEETRCTPGSHTGTIEHQAAFVLQALAYAHAAGVEKVFVFQLYDDSLGPGEHYGLVRNDGTPRPALTALRLAAAYLTGSGQADRALSSGGQLELITFRALEDERVRIVWNRSGELVVAGIPMEGSLPLKIDQTGAVQSLETGPGELLQLVLAPATLNDNPRWPPDYIVGGRPLLLVERGVEERPGEIAGLVQDGSGRALAGVPVQVGGYGAVSDGAGAFRVEVPSGLYDVFISPRSAFPPRSQPALSVPVWGGQATTRNLSVQPHQQKMLPFIPYRGRPEPRS